MNVRRNRIALAAAISLVSMPGLAGAISDCPADSVYDGYTCDQQTGAGKNGGFFRITFPSDWDGDLVIYNHGFDLNDKHIRPHETCSNSSIAAPVACEVDVDCGGGGAFCNTISYSGLDEILLPMGKAIAAPTYSTSGWATFESAKDIKDILKYVKKESGHGDQLQRVIITGFSGGGAVTVDATLKLKIDGAVPLCAAAGGGLPTWDVAMDVRLVYDFLCDGTGGQFPNTSPPDLGLENTNDPSFDAVSMATKVDACLGVIGVIPCQLGTCSISGNPCGNGFPDCPGMETCVATPGSCQEAQDQRLADFLALTDFSGGAGNVATAMGFATLGLGDFVRDPNRLDYKRIGFNTVPDLDYATMGVGGPLAASFDADVKRLAQGKGRKKLTKAYFPDYTKGKGGKIEYPILAMAGAADWLVIPEFQRVFTTALTTGGKAHTQTWIDTFGHCVFSEEETTAVFNEFFDWLGPVGGPYGTQPSAADVEAECIALGGVDGVTCNFNDAFVPGPIYDRIPPRSDWPAAAMP